MDFKAVIASLIPPILFSIAFLFLALSPFSAGKLVSVQNDVSVIFLENLSKSDIGSAISKTAEYLWSNLVLTLVVFLFIMDAAFIFELFASDYIDFGIFFMGSVIALAIPVFVSGLSYLILLPGVGVMVALIWIYKTFEEKRSDFSTGLSFVSSSIKIVNIFLAVGIFLAVFTGLDSYKDEISKANLNIIKKLMPDMEALKQVQIEQINQMTGGFKSSVDAQYNALPDQTKNTCGVMRTSLNKGLEDYRNMAVSEIQKQDITITDEQLSEILPFMDVFSKASPLFVAIMVYFAVSLINPFLAAFYGLIYFLVKRSPLQEANSIGQLSETR